MNKIAALAQLNKWALPTPPTWTTSARDLAARVPDSRPPPYYIRSDHVSLGKIGQIGDLESIRSFAEHAERLGYTDFSVQQLLDFEFGGACVIGDNRNSYFEAVYGMPLGLLRHGQLAVSCRVTGTAASWVGAVQDTEWSIDDMTVASRSFQSPGPSGLRECVAIARQQLASKTVTGLFEWGVVEGSILWLDWRPYRQIMALLRIIDAPLSPLESNAEIPRRPVLSDWDGGSDMHFEGGARLSHVITYAVERGDHNITFSG